MSQLTREEKLASFQQLTKVDGIKTGREFAESFSNKARLLIDHPHSYREWTIIGSSSVRGFYYLKSIFPLDVGEKYSIQTTFTLCLHESDFERISMSDDLTPDDVPNLRGRASGAHPDTKNQELSDYRRQLAEKDAEIARLQKRSAALEQLLGECIRNKYYDETACSPSWLKEAKAQLGV